VSIRILNLHPDGHRPLFQFQKCHPFFIGESLLCVAITTSKSPRTRELLFQFHERSQHFIGAHDETLSVTAMRVNNPNRSPLNIESCDPAETPSGFAQIVSDDFPYFTRWDSLSLLLSTQQ
jgi:hypothetical protein